MVPLAFLYAGFAVPLLWAYLTSNSIVPLLLVASQLLRLGTAVSIQRLRKASLLSLFAYFAAEILLLPVLGVLGLLTGDPAYSVIFRLLFASWFSLIFVSFSPFLVARYAASLLSRERLSRVLPEGVFLFGLLAFSLSIFSGASAGSFGSGFSALNQAPTGLVSAGLSFVSVSVTVTAIAIYLGLMLYSLARAGSDSLPWTKTLALALSGSVLAFLVSLPLGLFESGSVYLLAVPTAAVVGVLVLVTHGG